MEVDRGDRRRHIAWVGLAHQLVVSVLHVDRGNWSRLLQRGWAELEERVEQERLQGHRVVGREQALRHIEGRLIISRRPRGPGTAIGVRDFLERRLVLPDSLDGDALKQFGMGVVHP